MNITEILTKQQQSMNEDRREEHLHLDGIVGASDSGGCNLLGSYKAEHIPMPKVEGLKAESGAMDIGTIHHEWTQGKVLRENETNTNLREGEKFGVEIMVKVQITEKTTIESPIDIGLALSNDGLDPFVKTMWQFRNEQRETTVIRPSSTWIQIWDIKSCSDYAYFKYINNGEKAINRGVPIVPWKWKTQFHIYMKATGLKECTVLIIHKEKGWHHEIVVPWDDKVWEKLVAQTKRKEEIRAALKSGTTQLALTKSDLEFFNEEEKEDSKPICWYHCNLSETYEEIDAKGKPHLILKKPCEAASYFLKKEAQAKFAVGQMWQFGASHITIDEIDWDGEEMIYAHNKKGDTKECSIYAAVDSLVPIKPKGEK